MIFIPALNLTPTYSPFLFPQLCGSFFFINFYSLCKLFKEKIEKFFFLPINNLPFPTVIIIDLHHLIGTHTHIQRYTDIQDDWRKFFNTNCAWASAKGQGQGCCFIFHHITHKFSPFFYCLYLFWFIIRYFSLTLL